MKNATLRAMIMALAMVAGLTAAATPAWADLDAGIGVIRAPAPDTTSDNDGDADSDKSTTVTEETDTNDGADGNVDEDTDNAHPSGKDRSTESGSSGNQGKAESNPDDSKGPQRYEGARGDDKPGGPGGEDLADQDGNNGCGNDDDFDDDNNGHCGKPTATKTCSDGTAHGWECNGRGSGGSGGGSSVGASGSTTCPNKHMGGDDSGNGANKSGAYDSTCDGSPSGNGNGTGGSGKPCAGCVGNADDKNPRGQAPDGSDSNKGYECDENSGVGKTNPAHSGCTPSPGVISNPAEPDVLGRTDHACPAGTDNAGKKMSNPKDCNDDSVLGTMIRNAGPAGVAAKKVAAAVGAVLPFTGAGDLAAFLVLAGCLIAGGFMMMRRKREVGSEA